MGLKLSKLVEQGDEEKSLAIPVGDLTINVKYSRRRYTPRFEKKLKELSDEGLPGASLAEFLVSLLTEWDIVDEQNKPLPITVESLQDMPTTLQSRIVEAIAEDQRPNQKPSATTNDSF